jgi:fumarate hydratase class II
MRTESDSLGPVSVPDDALWGAQTQRAVENFAISGLRQSPDYIWATALVKRAAAEVNAELGLLDGRLSEAIAASQRGEGRALARAVRRGPLPGRRRHFPQHERQ